MDTLISRLKRALFYLSLLAVFALLLKIGLWFVGDSRAKLDHGKTTIAVVTGKYTDHAFNRLHYYRQMKSHLQQAAGYLKDCGVALCR